MKTEDIPGLVMQEVWTAELLSQHMGGGRVDLTAEWIAREDAYLIAVRWYPTLRRINGRWVCDRVPRCYVGIERLDGRTMWKLRTNRQGFVEEMEAALQRACQLAWWFRVHERGGYS